MNAELMQVLEAERASLAELRDRFRAARDRRDALAIEREIAQVKAHAEMALLRIQADYARRLGRLAVAREIESVIQAILHPPARRPAKPADRPPADSVRR